MRKNNLKLAPFNKLLTSFAGLFFNE